MLPEGFVPISDDPILKDVKRAVTWDTLHISKSARIIKLVSYCHYFKRDPNDPDGYAEEIQTVRLKPFERVFFAENRRLVNPTNGKLAQLNKIQIGISESGDPTYIERYFDTENQEVLNPVGQYDFYMYVIKNIPAVVDQMISSLIHEEDSIFHSFDA